MVENKKSKDSMKLEKEQTLMIARGEQYRVEERRNAYVSTRSHEIELDNIVYVTYVHNKLISIDKLTYNNHAILCA